jgi:hypothetical protein
MRNVFAEQQLEMWGENQHKELWRHEVAIYGGNQTFREIKADGSRGKATMELPQPKSGARPGSEWFTLLQRVASITTPLRYLGSSTYRGKTVHAYSYAPSAQDKVCDYREYVHGLVSSALWAGYVDCAGALVTDEQFNPLAIMQELYPPLERFTCLLRITVRYDFVVIPGSAAPLLLPSDLKLAGQFNDGRWHFAVAVWKDYHQFKVESAIKLETSMLAADTARGSSHP